MNADINLDEHGHLADFHAWTPAIAQAFADDLALHLTAQHYQILGYVRDFYHDFHHAPSTRALIKFLQSKNKDLNNAHLQALFNTGLVARHLSLLAGLPKPLHCF